MTAKKGMPTLGVELAGEHYNLRYDIESMMEVEQLVQTLALGTARADFFNMLDAPYNIREMVLMLQAGINGYYRYSNDPKRITTDEVRKLVQSHFNHIQTKVKGIPEWKKEQQKVHESISMAARLGAGLVVGDLPEEESPNPKKEKADLGVTK